jgi:hypothetical protein
MVSIFCFVTLPHEQQANGTPQHSYHGNTNVFVLRRFQFCTFLTSNPWQMKPKN